MSQKSVIVSMWRSHCARPQTTTVWRKNKIKKIIAIVLIFMMSVCILIACSKEVASPDSSQASTPATSQAPTPDDNSKDPTVMEELRKIKELEEKNIDLVAVYNEIASLAVENGWEADEETLKFINDADAVIKTFNRVITSPSSAHGADLDEMVSLAEDLTTELDTNIRERVSMPFGG